MHNLSQPTTTVRNSKPLFKAAVPLAVAVLTLLAGGAKADTFTVFNLNGTYDDGASLSGTMTIDTTVGSISAANIIIGAPLSLTTTAVFGQGTFSGGYSMYSLLSPYLIGVALNATSLVGYTGGTFNDAYTVVQSGNTVFATLTSGSITLPGTATAAPEPDSLLLMAAALIGSGCYWKLKSRAANR